MPALVAFISIILRDEQSSNSGQGFAECGLLRRGDVGLLEQSLGCK